jgi:hypothetical protein
MIVSDESGRTGVKLSWPVSMYYHDIYGYVFRRFFEPKRDEVIVTKGRRELHNESLHHMYPIRYHYGAQK